MTEPTIDTDDLFDETLPGYQTQRVEVIGQNALSEGEIDQARAIWSDLAKDLAPWMLSNRSALLDQLYQVLGSISPSNPGGAYVVVHGSIRAAWETQKLITAVNSSMQGDEAIRRAAFAATKQRITLAIDEYLSGLSGQEQTDTAQAIMDLVIALEYQ